MYDRASSRKWVPIGLSGWGLDRPWLNWFPSQSARQHRKLRNLLLLLMTSSRFSPRKSRALQWTRVGMQTNLNILTSQSVYIFPGRPPVNLDAISRSYKLHVHHSAGVGIWNIHGCSIGLASYLCPSCRLWKWVVVKLLILFLTVYILLRFWIEFKKRIREKFVHFINPT